MSSTVRTCCNASMLAARRVQCLRAHASPAAAPLDAPPHAGDVSRLPRSGRYVTRPSIAPLRMSAHAVRRPGRSHARPAASAPPATRTPPCRSSPRRSSARSRCISRTCRASATSRRSSSSLKSIGASAEWTARNALTIHAKTAARRPSSTRRSAGRSAPRSCSPGPLLARCGEIELPPPGGDVIGRRRVDTHFLALQQLGAELPARRRVHPARARSSAAPTSFSTSRASRPPRTPSPPPSPRRARRCSATPPASRTSRTSRSFLVAMGAQHRGHRHEHDHHPRRPSAPRLHVRDRPGPHRGRVVHRSRRRHALGDHASSAPASSTCAPRSWASSASASSAAIEGDDLVVPGEAGDGDPERPRRRTCPSSRTSPGRRSRRIRCRSRSSRRRSARASSSSTRRCSSRACSSSTS